MEVDNKKKAEDRLPTGWVKVKSKSHPGRYFFHNSQNKISVWTISEIFKLQNNELDPKKKIKTPQKSSSKPVPTNLKKIKKNVAEDRLKKLKKNLKDEIKRDSACGSQVSYRESYNTNGIDKKNEAAERMKKIREEQKTKLPSTAAHCETQTISEDKSAQPENGNDLMEVSFEEESKLSECESMEWEEIPEQEITQVVQKIRTTDVDAQSCSESTMRFTGKTTTDNSQTSKEENVFFVIVDTNVLLSNVDFIKEIKGKHFKDIGKALVYLPYIVLRELDHLKSKDENVARLARRAISFIDETFKSKDACIIGQSARESVEKQIIPVEGGDDEILNCCLRILETTKKVLLLTNDKNLRNKAFVNKIESKSREMMKSHNYNAGNYLKFE